MFKPLFPCKRRSSFLFKRFSGLSVGSVGALMLALTLSSFLSLSLTGCSTTPVDENDPVSLLKDAESEIKSDHFIVAIEKLRAIKNKFPYSNISVQAQLRIADVYFLQESYAEAAASYEAFRDLHPKHEKTAYAMFRAGKSYFNDMPSNIYRDLSTAYKALEAYQYFLNRYPHAEEVAEAEKDVASLRSSLANKELYIGDFYFKRDFYDSAKPRYKKVIELYPETEAAKTAEKKLNEIELKHGKNPDPT